MPKTPTYKAPSYSKPMSTKPLKTGSLTSQAAKLGALGGVGGLIPMGLGLYAGHKLGKAFKMHDHDSSEEMYDNNDYYRRRQYYPNK